MANSRYRKRPEHELQDLPDQELLAYLLAARGEGCFEEVKRGVAILAFGYLDILRARIALKVPAYAVDEVASDVLVSAFASAFAGESIGEFRSWLHTIMKRRIADWLESHKRDRETAPLPTEADEEGTWGPEPATEGGFDAVDTLAVVEQALGALSEGHRRVVALYVLQRRPTAEVAAATDESEDNIYKIAERFRKDLQRRLDEAAHPPDDKDEHG